MNPVELAIKYVIARVNKTILVDTFLDDEERRLRGTRNVEGAIHEKVISEYVVPDLSTKGGITFDVDLTGLAYEQLDQWTRVYDIPPERREGRDIVRAQYVARSIYAGSTTVVPNYFNQYGRRTGIAHQVEKMHQANNPINQTMSADIDILGPGVIAVRDFDLLHVSPVLKCKLKLSPNLEEVTSPYQSELNKLVYHCVRRYIFNELRVELDMGKLVSGRELGVYGQLVEDMADDASLYDEELEKWSKYLILMDKRSAQALYRNSGN